MAILEGYDAYERYAQENDGYKRVSQWTHSDTVEMKGIPLTKKFWEGNESDIDNAVANGEIVVGTILNVLDDYKPINSQIVVEDILTSETINPVTGKSICEYVLRVSTTSVEEANTYTDSKITEIKGNVSSDMNTLEKLSTAIKSNSGNINTLSTSLNNKVDKVDGKGLSTCDFTNEEKAKLSSIPSDAEANVQSDWNETDTTSDAFILNKPTSMPASDVQAWAKADEKPSYTATEVGALPDTTEIPTESTVSSWGFTKNTGTYSKPESGIPKTDLEASVQTSLGKADTALQEHQSLEDYVRTNDSRLSDARPASDVKAWAKADTKPTYTASEVGALPADTDLSVYALATESGYDLGLSLNSSTYEMTLELKNKAGTVLSTKTIDFPIESMVVNATYTEGVITLTLQNGTTLDVDISAIVGGLVNDSFTIAGIDMKDDITSEELKTALGVPSSLSELSEDTTHRTVTDAEKSSWNAKQESLSSTQLSNINNSVQSVKIGNTEYKEGNNVVLPAYPTSLPASGGNADTVNNHHVNADVPENAEFTDTTYEPATSSNDGLMSSADKSKLDGIAEGATANVGTITSIKMNGVSKGTSGEVDLGSVITSHQDISGKEDTSNKVTDWSNTTSNTKYPSEKLVKDSLDGKANSTHTHTKSQITDFPTSLPASDVYSWAKSATKPSYSAKEVGALASTTKISTSIDVTTNTLTASLKTSSGDVITSSSSTLPSETEITSQDIDRWYSEA